VAFSAGGDGGRRSPELQHPAIAEHIQPLIDFSDPMDEVTIQKIAAEVVRHLPSYPWLVLLFQVLLTLVAAGAGALFGEYFKTRGKNLAAKADFESLQEQLRATTQTVETIKSEVAQKDWARREWANLRRIKLEALLEKVHECGMYLSRLYDPAYEGKPISEADVLAALYFPELKSEADRFTLSCREQRALIGKLSSDVFDSRDDRAARQAVYQNFVSRWQGQYQELLLRTH
jgi:hypothetical protein